MNRPKPAVRVSPERRPCAGCPSPMPARAHPRGYAPDPRVAVARRKGLVEHHQGVAAVKHHITGSDRSRQYRVDRQAPRQPHMLLVVVQVGHVERQREHLRKRPRGRVVLQCHGKAVRAADDHPHLGLLLGRRGTVSEVVCGQATDVARRERGHQAEPSRVTPTPATAIKQ